jgi:tripartite ATP-independent transporter DctP family solute receptor
MSSKKRESIVAVFAIVLMAVAVSLLCLPAAGHAAPVEIRASHDSTTASPWHLGMVRFAELVDKKSNGALKVRIFPPGQLSQSNIRTTIELLQSGSLHCAPIVISFYEGFDPRFMAFSMPFLFKDREQTYRVLDGPVGEKWLNMFKDKGLIGLAFWDHGYRQITNSKRPIRKPEDLRGLNIRTPLATLKASIFKHLGATTTPIAMGELYMALQQRMADGQENPFNTIYRRKFYETQKYVTEWNYQYSPLPLIMNLDFFNSLSPERQAIVKSAAKEAGQYQRKLSAEEDEMMKKKLVEAGMELTVLTPQELGAFKKAMEPVYQEFEPQIGKDLLKELMDALK